MHIICSAINSRGKKNLIALLLLNIILPLLPGYVGTCGAAMPSWTKTGQDIKYPKALYLSAIGEGETMELADRTAMIRIGEQIQVSVKSEFSMLKQESSFDDKVSVTEDASLMIATRVDIENLEGLTIVERHFDSKRSTHYSLAALDREKASAGLVKHINEAYGLANEFYKTAESHREKLEIAQALHAYSRSIEEYKRGRPKENILNVVAGDLDDKRVIKVQPLSDMEGRLIDTISRCRIEVVSGSQQKGVFGKKLEEPLVVRALYQKGDKFHPITGLLLKFTVVKGEATIQDEVATNEKGVAASIVSRVSPSGVKDNIIDVTLNVSALEYIKAGPVTRFIYILPIKEDVKVAVKIDELNFGRKLDTSIVDPMIMKALKDSGFNVVQSSSDADFLVTGEINSSRKGALGSVIFAHSTGAVRIVDSKTGNVVKEIEVNPEVSKGGGVNNETAGISALRNAGKNTSESVVSELERVFNENF